MQRIDLPDPEAANTQILDDLNNGASGVALVFEGAVGDYGYALPRERSRDRARARRMCISTAGIALELDFGPPSREAAGIVATLVKARGLAPADRQHCASASIRSAPGHAWRGAEAVERTSRRRLPGSIADLAGQGFAGPFAVADARPVHAAGGSEAQELAFALANAVAYLRALEAQRHRARRRAPLHLSSVSPPTRTSSSPSPSSAPSGSSGRGSRTLAGSSPSLPSSPPRRRGA